MTAGILPTLSAGGRVHKTWTKILKWNNCCAFTHYNTQVFTFDALIYCSTTNLHNPEAGFMIFTLVWERCQTEWELIKQGLTFIGGISQDRPPPSLVQEEARIEDGWMEVYKKKPQPNHLWSRFKNNFHRLHCSWNVSGTASGEEERKEAAVRQSVFGSHHVTVNGSIKLFRQ